MIKYKLSVLVLGSSLVLSGCNFLDTSSDTEKKPATTTPEKNSQLDEKKPLEKEKDENTDSKEGQTPEDNKENDANKEEPPSENSEEQHSKDPNTKNDVVESPSSLEVVINKQRQLPAGYVPPNLVVPDVPFYFDQFMQKKQMRKVAADALEQLFAAAEQNGLELVAASGYRSYDRQKTIYQGNVKKYGAKRANQFSAQPGHSEHQTGLAMDVTVAQLSFKLVQEFGNTTEGDWLADNAYKYGFIIRYPKGKEDITGYSYEPWHLRYVGEEVAKAIHEQNSTLEEYYNLVPKQ